jgi:hypothetical protein
MGVLTSRNPDAPKGLEQRLSIGIHKIPAELLHPSREILPDPKGFQQSFHA